MAWSKWTPDEVRRTRLGQDDALMPATAKKKAFVMAWVYLFVAGLFEAVWAVGLKYTEGFTRAIPSAVVAGAMVGSMVLLAIAVKTIPLATAYAIWVSIGIAATAVAQAALLKQPLAPLQILFLAMLLVAVVGLKLAAK
jgi:quaternary ammonium compound-resistance protein SugE